MSVVFNDLDTTLKAILDDAAAPAALRAADVSFDTPDKDYQPAQATVNLFLHEVSENRELRDNAPMASRDGPRHTVGRPVLRVDCTYLVTTWSAAAGGLKAAEEHGLLGLALQWLSRFPVIDERFLRGALVPSQPYPLPTVVARSVEGRSSGEFWSALGVPPRPAFPVTVTVTVAPYDETQEHAAVQAVRIVATQPRHPALAGRVLDHTLAPVAGATVTVVETGAAATTAADGGFTLAGLDFGGYTLRAQAPGRVAQQSPVAYAAEHQFHTVVLTAP